MYKIGYLTTVKTVSELQADFADMQPLAEQPARFVVINVVGLGYERFDCF